MPFTRFQDWPSAEIHAAGLALPSVVGTWPTATMRPFTVATP